MIALRYFCGFSLQIFPYAFFCLYPFRVRFRLSTKKTMLMALSIFIVMVIPFSLIAQFNIGGDYKELIWNVIFYIALLLFGVLYCFIIQAKIAEKLFVFFVVMSYGFFVTSTVTFLHRTFQHALGNPLFFLFAADVSHDTEEYGIHHESKYCKQYKHNMDNYIIGKIYYA